HRLDLISLEGQIPRGVVLDHTINKPLYLRESRSKIRGVCCHHDVITVNPLDELEWSGSHRILAEPFATVLPNGCRAAEFKPSDSEIVEHGGIGRLQDDLERAWVNHFCRLKDAGHEVSPGREFHPPLVRGILRIGPTVNIEFGGFGVPS